VTTMRSLLPALLLLLACDGPPPPAPPAAPPAAPAPPPAAPTEDEHPGFADPKTVETPPAPTPQVPTDTTLAARITEKFGERCKHERSCGDLLGIDCQSATDGPYYYAQRSDLKTVATCGGACRGGCTDCPPKAWTCPTY